MTSLFLHFLKRDSRSSHTWIIRTILSALILLLAGWALADESIPSVELGMVIALILGVVASLTNLNAFRENAWRETLMLVHSTRVRPGELFLVRLAARSVPCLLCVLPVLVLLMELNNRAGTLLWLPCATYAFCAILFGLGAGMFSSCLSTRSSIVGREMHYAAMVWMLSVMFPLMLTPGITRLWNSWSAGAGDILTIVALSFMLLCLLSFSRQMIGCPTGRADRLKLLTLMGFILIPFVFLLLPGTVFKYWVYPAALALGMIPLALACLHLACRVERDPEYFQNSLRWRFLAPMLDRLRSGEDKLQAKLAKRGVSKSLPIHATAAHASDSVPSRPGTWANAYLGVNDGGTSPRPAFFGRMRLLGPALMIPIFLLIPFISFESAFPTNRIKDILFIAGMEFLVFLYLMFRASLVLRGDRSSGMLDLVLVSPLSSRGITDGVLHSFADIRREYLLYLAVAGCCVLTFSHLSLWRGDGWNEWSVCIYVPLSFALCHSGRLKSLWILSCRDGLLHARSGVVLLRPLAILVVHYGVFLSFFALAGNEPVRLALCILFPFLHQRILDHMARRSMTGLLRMHHSMQE